MNEKITIEDKQKHRNFISKFTQVITAHFFAMQRKRDKKLTENKQTIYIKLII